MSTLAIPLQPYLEDVCEPPKYSHGHLEFRCGLSVVIPSEWEEARAINNVHRYHHEQNHEQLPWAVVVEVDTSDEPPFMTKWTYWCTCE